jgi:hypothetical protein
VTARELAHQVSGFCAAWTLADPAIKSAANDTPATNAARFIAQTPSTHNARTHRQFSNR